MTVPEPLENQARLYLAAARMFGWTATQVDNTPEHILRALLRLAHLGDEDDGTSGQPAVPPEPDDRGPTIAINIHGHMITERELADLVAGAFSRQRLRTGKREADGA